MPPQPVKRKPKQQQQQQQQAVPSQQQPLFDKCYFCLHDTCIDVEGLARVAKLLGGTVLTEGEFVSRAAAYRRVTDVHFVYIVDDDVALALDDGYKRQFITGAIEKLRALKPQHVCTAGVLRAATVGANDAATLFKRHAVIVDPEAEHRLHAESALPPTVQSLVELIFDTNAVFASLADVGVGEATVAHALAQSDFDARAFKILGQMDACLSSAKMAAGGGGGGGASQQAEMVRLNAKFNDAVRLSSAAAINSVEDVERYTKLVDMLHDVVTTARIKRAAAEAAHNSGGGGGGGGGSGSGASTSVHPTDVKYAHLHAQLAPLAKNTLEFDTLDTYLCSTQSPLHADEFRLELDEAFSVDRQGEAERFAPFADDPNRVLLWHGSRLANFVGILSEGLRIAPPEAPVTGYYLGKGVYFADISSKSAQYCHATREQPYGLMLLCEVACGRPFELAHGKYITLDDVRDNGFGSTHCWGEFAPHPALAKRTATGCTIPTGRAAPTDVVMPELKHSEFVVYDTAQIRVRYLLKVRFMHGGGGGSGGGGDGSAASGSGRVGNTGAYGGSDAIMKPSWQQ